MKLAILVCERIIGVCSTSPCFKVYNNKTKHFEQYVDTDIELQSFLTCQACSSNSYEFLEKAATRLKDVGVKRIHFGACVRKCSDIEGVTNMFKRCGIDVHEGTH